MINLALGVFWLIFSVIGMLRHDDLQEAVGLIIANLWFAAARLSHSASESTK